MAETYDYVIVGGGMTACGIVAELLDFRPDSNILILDNQKQLGGHWNFAYPYVKLHNFTSYYTLYGYKMPEYIRSKEKHRADLTEIMEYFNSIQRRFEKEKKLEMRFNLEMKEVEQVPGAEAGGARWTIKYADKAGKTGEVKGKTLVMCTHCAIGRAPPHKPIVGAVGGTAPKGNIYPNQIAQMGDLKALAKKGQKIAVVGGGKTGADAVMHLYTSGVPMENIVWVKKFDLGFGIRASPQEAFDPPEKRGRYPLMIFALISKYWWKTGVPKSLMVHGTPLITSTLPDDHPKYTDKVYFTGGGMIDMDELAMLRTVRQVLGGSVVANADGKLTLEDGSVIEYDHAVWCHGYDQTPYAKVPRQSMTIGMLSPGYMAPINMMSSASQGGRFCARLLLMFEEDLLSFWHKFTFTLMVIFMEVFCGAPNSVLTYTRAGLCESWLSWAISRPKVVARFGWPYMSAMGDMPWIIPGYMKGAKENIFKYIHLEGEL